MLLPRRAAALLALFVTMFALAPAAHAAPDASLPTLRSSATTGDYPITVVTSPDGANAFATNYYDDTVSIYTRDADGDLTPAGTAPTGDVPWHAIISPDGKNAYVTNYTEGSISMYARNATTGALTPLPSSPIGDSLVPPTTMVISPDGKHVYTVNEGDDSITSFTRDAATGELTFLQNVASGNVTMALAMSPDGKYLYHGSCDGGVIAVLERDPATGLLTGDPIAGFTPANWPRTFTMGPGGGQLYAANESSDTVSIYTIDPTDGSLSAGPSAPALPGGSNPRTIAFNASGTHGYVAYRATNQLGVFARSAVDGALTHVRDITTGGRPTTVTANADGTLHLTESNDDRISTFQLAGPSADLELAATAPKTVTMGDTVKVEATVSNREPVMQSTGATLTLTLPASVTFQPAGSSSGCAVAGAAVTCPVGVLAASAGAQFTVNLTAARAGATQLPLAVSGVLDDPRTANNSTSLATTIVAAPVKSLCPKGTSAGVVCKRRAGGGLLITGTAKADRIIGTAKNDSIRAGGGNDTVRAGAGSDVVDGGSGADVIYGQSGRDVLTGGAGRDQLLGGGGNDLLISRDGGTRDILNGGYGVDTARADAADVLRYVRAR